MALHWNIKNNSFIMFWQYSKIVVLNTSFFEKIMEICIINAAYLSQICLILASYMKQVWLWRRLNDTAKTTFGSDPKFQFFSKFGDDEDDILHFLGVIKGILKDISHFWCQTMWGLGWFPCLLWIFIRHQIFNEPLVP